MLKLLRPFLATALALGLAAQAQAATLEIQITATDLFVTVGTEPGGGDGGGNSPEGGEPTFYRGVDMVATGQYDSGDIRTLIATGAGNAAGPGFIEYVEVDFRISFSDGDGDIGTFNTIGLGVWDLDDPDNPFQQGVLLVSDPDAGFGFALEPADDIGDIGFDLGDEFPLTEFQTLIASSGAFPTEEGVFIDIRGGIAAGAAAGDDDVIIDDDVPIHSVRIDDLENPIPEPSAALLFGIGLVVAGARSRRR